MTDFKYLETFKPSELFKTSATDNYVKRHLGYFKFYISQKVNRLDCIRIRDKH